MSQKQKYTVIKDGRHGRVNDVLMLYPRQATFLLTQQIIVKGEQKAKAAETKVKVPEK